MIDKVFSGLLLYLSSQLWNEKAVILGERLILFSFLIHKPGLLPIFPFFHLNLKEETVLSYSI